MAGPFHGFSGAGENGHLVLGSWGALAVIFKEQALYFGELESKGGGGGAMPPRPRIYISVLLFRSILLAKIDLKMPFRLALTSISSLILAKNEKHF